MLELRSCCECCGKDLRVDDTDVYICSFECTWCGECVARFPGGMCPNCGGNLTPRPVRPAALLDRYPASQRRVVSETCAEQLLRDEQRR